MQTVRKLEEVIVGHGRNTLKILSETKDYYIACYENSVLGRRFIVDKSDVYKEGERLKKVSNVYYVLYEEVDPRVKELKYVIVECDKCLKKLKYSKEQIENNIEEVQKLKDSYESQLKQLVGGTSDGYCETHSEKTT